MGVLGVAMLTLAAGLVLHWAPGQAPLFIGTLVAGAAVAVANVAVPAAVKEDFPEHAGVLLGLHSTMLAGGPPSPPDSRYRSPGRSWTAGDRPSPDGPCRRWSPPP